MCVLQKTSGRLCMSVHGNAGEVVPDDLVNCGKKRRGCRSLLSRHIEWQYRSLKHYYAFNEERWAGSYKACDGKVVSLNPCQGWIYNQAQLFTAEHIISVLAQVFKIYKACIAN